MRGTSVSSGQMTMIAYPIVVLREWFLAYMTLCRAMVCFPLFVGESYHGDIGG